MAQQYLPGQRWISDSEAELGLGTILMQDGRMLTVLYPATGETRQYAARSAPLTCRKPSCRTSSSSASPATACSPARSTR